MEKKADYEVVKIEVIEFEEDDVIATSGLTYNAKTGKWEFTGSDDVFEP